MMGYSTLDLFEPEEFYGMTNDAAVHPSVGKLRYLYLNILPYTSQYTGSGCI